MAQDEREAEQAPSEDISIQEKIRLRRLKAGTAERAEQRRQEELANKRREAEREEKEEAERAKAEAEAARIAAEKEAAENIPIQEKFKPGQWVEIFGLGSADGKKLNNKVGTVVQYVYERIRFEVRLAPDKTIAVRPVNLREAERPDKKWRFGDLCRLVCLREEEDEELRKKSGCLGTLRFRGKEGAWKVECMGGIYSVQVDQLRVCERPAIEGKGKSKLDDLLLDEDESDKQIGPPQIIAGVLMAVTFGLLFAIGSATLDIHRGPNYSLEGGYGEESELGSRILGSAVSPQAPGLYVGGLSLACLGWIVISQWTTIGVCAWNHRCLWDPQTTFPQIAELSISRPQVRILFRYGLGCVSVLLFCTNWLHKELVMPHLPWANGDSLEAETAVFWVVGAAAGIGLQGFFTLTEHWGYHSLAHHFGGLVVAYCLFQHLRETRKFYFPGSQPLNEGVEEGVEREDIKEAMEMALDSPLLKNPYVLSAVMIRFHLFGLWPWGLLMLPVLQHIFEKMPEESKVSGNTIWRSLYAWTQWYLSFICSCLLMTYGPEMVIASLLPMQNPTEAASARDDKFFF